MAKLRERMSVVDLQQQQQQQQLFLLQPDDRPQQSSLFTVDVSSTIGPDFAPMANDVARMVCIQVAIQLMLVLASGGANGIAFFSSEFLLLVFYIVLGVMLYWLAVRKLVVFA